MNKHDYMHRLKEANEHLRQAKTACTQPQVLDHIEQAKNVVWLLADDMGADLIKTEGD
jgi:hypothetical protein